LEGLADLGALLLALLRDDVAPGEDDVALARAVDALDDAGELLAHEDREVVDAVDVDLARGHEGGVVRHFQLKPALVHPGDARLDHLAGLEELPRGLLHRAGARAHEQLLLGVVAVDDDLDLLAHLRKIGFVGVLRAPDDAELLRAELDEDVGRTDGDDAPLAVLASALDHARAADRALLAL